MPNLPEITKEHTLEGSTLVQEFLEDMSRMDLGVIDIACCWTGIPIESLSVAHGLIALGLDGPLSKEIYLIMFGIWLGRRK